MFKKKVKKEEPKAKEIDLVELLVKEIPNCFDSPPRGAVNRTAVERLVDKILE